MTKLNFTRFLIFSLCVLTIISCGKKDNETKPSGPSDNSSTGPAPAFLKVGAVYNYDYDNFFTGTIETKIEACLAKDTFLVRNYTDLDVIYPTQYYVLNKNELSVSYRLRDKDSYNTVVKFNSPVGTTWTETINNILYTYTIDAINETITTGSGEVKDAIKVKMTGGSSTVYNYYSPTVGMLGTGSYGSETEMVLKSYTLGSELVEPSGYPITFGTFPFMSEGKTWTYKETDFVGNEDEIKLEILSKLSSNTNIYKVKLTIKSTNDVSYEYWYEDNGLLMVYEEGESYLKADPIYMKESTAKLGYGWTGKTSTGTTFIYKIKEIDVDQETYFGTLKCMGVSVSSGLFSSQTNYWHKDKGNVLVTGLVERQVVSSNAKKPVQGILIAGFNF